MRRRLGAVKGMDWKCVRQRSSLSSSSSSRCSLCAGGANDRRRRLLHGVGAPRTLLRGRSASPLGARMSDFVPASGVIDHQEFLRRLSLHFPDLASALDRDERELVHLGMAAVARATTAAIDHRQWSQVVEHFTFVDALLEKATSEIANAVYVSYLENIFGGANSDALSIARAKLPGRLRNALTELEQHMEALARGAGT